MSNKPNKGLKINKEVFPKFSGYFVILTALFVIGMIFYPYANLNYSIDINKSLTSFTGIEEEHNIGKFEEITLTVISNNSIKIQLSFIPFQQNGSRINILNNQLLGPTNSSFTQKLDKLFLSFVSNQNKTFRLYINMTFSYPGKLLLKIMTEFSGSPDISGIWLKVTINTSKDWNRINSSLTSILKWLVLISMFELLVRTIYVQLYSYKSQKMAIKNNNSPKLETIQSKQRILVELSLSRDINKNSLARQVWITILLSTQMLPASYVLIMVFSVLTLLTNACKFPTDNYVNSNAMYDFIELVSSNNFLSISTFSLIFNVILVIYIFNQEKEELYPILSYPLPKTVIVFSRFIAGVLAIITLFVPWFILLFYFRYYYFLGVSWSTSYKEYVLVSIFFMTISMAQFFLLSLVHVLSKSSSISLIFSFLIMFFSRITVSSNSVVLFFLSFIYPSAGINYQDFGNKILVSDNTLNIIIIVIEKLVFSLIILLIAIFHVKIKNTLLREE